MKFTLLLIPLSISLATAATFSTTFDSANYSDAALHNQDGWVAQGNWAVDTTNGNTSTTSGAFIRAQNTNALWDTAVGTSITVNSSFSLQGNYNATNGANIDANWKEGIFTTGLSDQLANQAPSPHLLVGLYLDEHPATADGNLKLQGPGGAVTNIGAPASFDGANWDLSVTYTYAGMDTYNYTASLTDGTSTFSISGSDTDAALAANTGDSIAGLVQLLPVGGDSGTDGAGGLDINAYNGITMDGFEVCVIPEPTSVSLAGIALGAFLLRRRR